MCVCVCVCVLPVFSTDVGHNVLVEELEDEGDAVGKHQVLTDVLKLQKHTHTHTHTING